MLLPPLKQWGPFAAIACICAGLASQASTPADWDIDAGPAVEALAAGDVGEYLIWPTLVGPFATLLQAPFVALSGTTGAVAYQWATFPCLLVAGVVGVQLGRIAVGRGVPPLTGFLISLLFVLNPLTFEALGNGHPEEILAAALAIAALAAAAKRRLGFTAVLLGLAIASKQWAVIAILPALLVLPAARVKVGLGALAAAAVLFLPGIVASPAAFEDVQRAASGTPGVVTPWSAWYPVAVSRTETYSVHGERLVAEVEEPPSLVADLSHPLVVLLALAIPIAVAFRRRLPLSAADGFALLALLALLRCVLDPVDNLYYHAPLLLAVIGWDAFSSRGLPLRSLLAVAAAMLFWRGWHDLSDPAPFNAVYLAFASVLGIGLASSLFGVNSWTAVPTSPVLVGRNSNFRDQGT
jgi:Glycosyltransferase family 87